MVADRIHVLALVVRSGDTLTALENVLSTVRDAETGQRGYLLTDEESYLGPYNAAASPKPVQLIQGLKTAASARAIVGT